MKTKINLGKTKLSLVTKTILCCLALIMCSSIYAQVNNLGIQCYPEFDPCQNVNVLDFTENGINWGEDDMTGTYTVGEQTFDISIDDPNGIFAPFQPKVDSDDIGSFENNTGIAVGINPYNTDDVIEINYNLSLVSDYVAFTIRDIDSKYKYASKQIEKVCVYGYLNGVEILPTITPFCGGSVEVNGNCAVGKADSADGKDESIRIVFETCIDEIKIVYGNASNAGNDPTYSRIFIGDDTGFGTAVCTDECIPCTAESSEIALEGAIGDSDGAVCADSDTEINVTVTGGNGENSAWVITDEQTNIISTTDTPPFILNEVGTYLIWYLNWDGDLSAAPEVGANAGEIVGASECAALSNPIKIDVAECCTANSSEIVLTGGSENICVDDNVDEPIDVQVNGGNGENSAWVITDQSTNILGLPDGPPFILDGAGVGTCLIWYLNWDGDLAAMPELGANAGDLVNDSFCAKLSNPITITREVCCTAEMSTIEITGGSDVICVDDSTDEPIDVQITGGNGENSAWVITDEQTNILGLPDGPPFVLDGAGVGTCLIWYLNWDGDLSAMPELGANAGDIVNNSDCAALSNSIPITRQNCCTAEMSTIEITGGSDVVCVDDSTDEPIDVQITGGNGENSAWVITDEQTNILGLPDGPPFVLDGAGVGTCLIWYLNWDGDLSAMPELGANAGDIVNNSECAALSNSIPITRQNCCTAELASITIDGGSDMLDVCVNDEDLTTITFSLVDAGNGENSAWVITDENAIIKSVSSEIPSLDLYDSDLGTMQIWYLNWDGNLSAAPEVDANAADIVAASECAALSNPITIVKDCCCPYSIQFAEDNLLCSVGNLIARPILVVDESLALDNGRVICDDSVIPCSEAPTVLDSNGERALNPLTLAGDYSATISCTCAPDTDFVLTQEVLDVCNDTTPILAPVPSIMGITESSATLSYDFNNPLTIEFRKVGDSTFEGFESDLGMAFLAGLESCTSYEYRSSVNDINGDALVSEIQTFTTSGCRNINITDVNLRSLNVRATSAILSWDNMPGCIYTFYYRVEGENEWQSYDTSIPYVVLFGLNPCTNYEWALRINDEEIRSERSAAQLISTTCQGPRLSDPNAADVKIGDLKDLQDIELDLYVNSSTATLTINYLGLPINGVSIYSASGQLVEALRISNTALNTIDVSSLDPGVYILVSNFDNGFAKNKFVISK